jgi:hypothetical protein
MVARTLASHSYQEDKEIARAKSKLTAQGYVPAHICGSSAGRATRCRRTGAGGTGGIRRMAPAELRVN